MQQRQSTASQFATQSAASQAKSAPIALDAATLKLVAGGVQAAGPNGGWASAAVEGPNGGW
ncbi:MAG: hypothetical protein Q8R33_02520 [Burkholderiales bacterium]|nr:hypothetical protein [Burkholderiales bacterium]